MLENQDKMNGLKEVIESFDCYNDCEACALGQEFIWEVTETASVTMNICTTLKLAKSAMEEE